MCGGLVRQRGREPRFRTACPSGVVRAQDLGGAVAFELVDGADFDGYSVGRAVELLGEHMEHQQSLGIQIHGGITPRTWVDGPGAAIPLK